MNKTFARKWVEENVDTAKLKQKILSRFESEDFGYNESKSKRGMYLQTIVTDAYTRWTNVELAAAYGFLTEEVKAFHYDNDLWHISVEEQIGCMESDICEVLKEVLELEGVFTIGWSDPIQDNIENYYGICYEEAM